MTRTTMTTAPRTSASDMATASASAQVGPASGSARSRRPSLGPRFDAPCASGPASAVAAVGASAVWHGRCAHLDYPEHGIAVPRSGHSALAGAHLGRQALHRRIRRRSVVEARDHGPTSRLRCHRHWHRSLGHEPTTRSFPAPTGQRLGEAPAVASRRAPRGDQVRAGSGAASRRTGHLAGPSLRWRTPTAESARRSLPAATMIAPRSLGQAAGPGKGGRTDADPVGCWYGSDSGSRMASPR